MSDINVTHFPIAEIHSYNREFADKSKDNFVGKLISSKEFSKNLPAIKHVESERAKSNKEVAAPVPYYILLVMLTGRCSTEIRPTFHARRLLVVQLLL